VKFVFLDIDGVLNIGTSRKVGILEKYLIDRLNKITDHEDVQVVLTSSWGLFHGFAETLRDLDIAGFKGNMIEYLYDEIPREQRIANWLLKYRHDSYVVIDDHLMPEFGDKQVVVDSKIGLSDADVIKALACLHVAPVMDA